MMSALPVLLRSGGSPAFGGERDPQLQTPNTSEVAYAEDLCRLSWGRLPLVCQATTWCLFGVFAYLANQNCFAFHACGQMWRSMHNISNMRPEIAKLQSHYQPSANDAMPRIRA
ncbi:hypothetical protein HYQ44_007155 [Verticillium longisporum]|nr:hypothetical protein HYQ44_007155 [Verticillium longisporum]